MKTKRTSRGFRIYAQFKDLYGCDVRVQASSLATKRAVWIFPEVKQANTGEWLAGAHLSVVQAKRIIKALQRFVNGEG